MSTLAFKSVRVPLPALLSVVFAAGIAAGVWIGVASVLYGYNKVQDEARIERLPDATCAASS
ncbi:hypothetical protein ACF0C0_12375 [Pseudomonas aeruginosa]|uniref:Uncharacterized protein n=1 Tax=Pseudomonas aeruginosa TaxID=287 RepID=A0A6B1YFF6_PSEAI|nr:hypothetical protein [Pseudomonas aeruginosa]MZZ16615.1 hypothetical protein [Pseudomonas aeruginosa]HBN9243693.1 hypothetical protein [Pseudomonas aeruginosa]HCH7474686.1 hypothetical protein [Pseudomonas aeruginosa]HCH7803181.1 hypothetical protein [Pseudomonas aeruginosa]HCI4168580.1 hypothetical protein [Pseudomonas aeruginosa]